MLLIIVMEEILIFMKYDANFMQLLLKKFIFLDHASLLPVKTNACTVQSAQLLITANSRFCVGGR